MSITALFEKLGAPLANSRWSWGGIREDGSVVLRVWQNETKRIGDKTHVQLTHRAVFAGREDNLGYQERNRHVEHIRAGAHCYMVMCEPKSTQAVPREIKSFNEREFFWRVRRSSTTAIYGPPLQTGSRFLWCGAHVNEPF
ncbi:MAG: hypothetical protein ACYCWB_12310 [Thiobacillus sp.]